MKQRIIGQEYTLNKTVLRSKLEICFVDISILRKVKDYTKLVLNTLKDYESNLFVKCYGSVVYDDEKQIYQWETRDLEVIY